jgi:hypothetical protein
MHTIERVYARACQGSKEVYHRLDKNVSNFTFSEVFLCAEGDWRVAVS